MIEGGFLGLSDTCDTCIESGVNITIYGYVTPANLLYKSDLSSLRCGRGLQRGL